MSLTLIWPFNVIQAQIVSGKLKQGTHRESINKFPVFSLSFSLIFASFPAIETLFKYVC